MTLYLIVFSVNMVSIPLAYSKESRPLSFAILQLTPYAFKSDQGVTEGYLYDTMAAILNHAGIEENIEVLPLKRLLEEFKAGSQDCTLIADTTVARSHFRIIEPIGKAIEAGVLPAYGKTINSYGDLKKLRIGIPLGVSFDARFDADTSLNKISTLDYVGNVRMLSHGRLDAIAGSIDSFRYDARQMGKDPDKLFGTPFLFTRLELVLACAQEKPAKSLIEKLRTSLRALRKSGAIQAIIDRYL